MASPAAIRYVAATSKSALGHINFQCHVKPGASKQREGIISISDHVIELCVSAQPRDGEANEAVRKVFSDALKCPKSDVEVIRGLKSRDKTVSIAIDVNDDEKTYVQDFEDSFMVLFHDTACVFSISRGYCG